MVSLPPPRVQYQEIYSPRDEDFTIEPGTHVNLNENVNVNPQATAEADAIDTDTDTADEHEFDLDIDIAIAIADENAYGELIASMPTTAEDLPAAEEGEIPVSVLLASVFASIPNPAHVPVHTSTPHVHTPTCTTASPCGLHVDCRSTPRDIELHNTALAALVRESDPLTWEEVREHDRRRWAAIGEMALPQSQAARRAGITV
jgi:hypothetical protein